MSEKGKSALVIQGGSLRSIFTSGVLDAFMANRFDPFDIYIGVSGGAMCLSFYLTKQYKTTHDIMMGASQDSNFISIRQFFYEEGYVNLAYLQEFTEKNHPLDVEAGMEHLTGRSFEAVATNMETGDPVYLRPNAENWKLHLKASSTLPFFTKGYCTVDNQKLMDGGWSDPIPVKAAIARGATKIAVIRTLPQDYELTWSYLGVLGSYIHRNNPGLAKRFSHDYEIYNDTIRFMKNPPEGIEIHQISPTDFLKTGSYSTALDKLKHDYRWGMEQGNDFLRNFGERF
jgi:predicted patatin/cPLA2 family phospholipase